MNSKSKSVPSIKPPAYPLRIQAAPGRSFAISTPGFFKKLFGRKSRGTATTVSKQRSVGDISAPSPKKKEGIAHIQISR
jgi:hypothetical protein